MTLVTPFRRRTAAGAAVLTALLTGALAAPAVHAAPADAADPYPTTSWPTATPAETGADNSLIQQAIAYSTDTRTVGGSGMIIYKGRLISSWGAPATAQLDIKSSTKSFGSALAGIAYDDGLISLNDTISSHVPTFGTAPGDQPATDNTEWRRSITIADALTHTSGINKAGATGDLLFAPGTMFSYSDNGMNRVADVLTTAFDQDLKTVLQERIFGPIGVTTSDYTWRNPADASLTGGGYGSSLNGNTRREFGSGLKITVDAMARFGYLMLRDGVWVDADGAKKQVMPRDYITMMSKPTGTAGVPNYLPDPGLYANASSNYGLGWWNNHDGAVKGLPKDAYWSWGLYDSFVMVVPSLDLVVARAQGAKSWQASPNWGVYASMEPFFAPIAASVVKKCPEPDPRATVVIGDTDSGVPNSANFVGCTINDLIEEESGWRNKGAFIQHVKAVADQLIAQGVLDRHDRSEIVSAAARS
jgi:CubicO group peptidase (beta-lactamase class C family)